MKKAKEIKSGDIIVLAGEKLRVEEIEISDVGKQGKEKVRIVAKKANGESVTVIRPSDYPMQSE